MLHMGIPGVELHAHTHVGVRPRKAKELPFTGGSVRPAAPAEQLMVNQAVPLAELVPATMESGAADRPHGRAPALRMAKRGQPHDGRAGLHDRRSTRA